MYSRLALGVFPNLTNMFLLDLQRPVFILRLFTIWVPLKDFISNEEISQSFEEIALRLFRSAMGRVFIQNINSVDLLMADRKVWQVLQMVQTKDGSVFFVQVF